MINKASVIKTIINISNYFDSNGMEKEADVFDRIMIKMADLSDEDYDRYEKSKGVGLGDVENIRQERERKRINELELSGETIRCKNCGESWNKDTAGYAEAKDRMAKTQGCIACTCDECGKVLDPGGSYNDTVNTPDGKQYCKECGKGKVKEKPDMYNTTIETWFERDRSHVELRDKETEKTLLEFWDDNVQDMVDSGYLDPKDWHGSMLEYYNDHFGGENNKLGFQYVNGTIQEIYAKFKGDGWVHNADKGRFEKGGMSAKPIAVDTRGHEWGIDYKKIEDDDNEIKASIKNIFEKVAQDIDVDNVFEEKEVLPFKADRIGECDECHDDDVEVMELDDQPGEYQMCKSCYDMKNGKGKGTKETNKQNQTVGVAFNKTSRQLFKL